MAKFTTKTLARAGIIASLYIVLSILVLPLASGALQLRLSELLTVLPLIYVEAVPALFIGCLLSNLLAGCALLDVFLGAIVTLISAVCTYFISRLIKGCALRILLGGIFPVTLNAFILPLIWLLCYEVHEYAYIIQALLLLASQTLVIYGLGTPTCISVISLRKRGVAFLK